MEYGSIGYKELNGFLDERERLRRWRDLSACPFWYISLAQTSMYNVISSVAAKLSAHVNMLRYEFT